LLVASLFLCLLPGCWPFKPKDTNGDIPPQEELKPRTSPENVLYNLRIVYGDKDNIVNTDQDAHIWAETYRSLFHSAPDTFKFYFIPADTPPQFPEGWWGINDEVAGFENMLRSKVAGVTDDIQLTWSPGLSEPDARVGHTGWKHILVSGVLLDVIQGETIYRVSNGSADFFFAPDPNDPSLWVITEWWDKPPVSGSPLVQGSTAFGYTTWSVLKAHFR
jgi:hypothetical protein